MYIFRILKNLEGIKLENFVSKNRKIKTVILLFDKKRK